MDDADRILELGRSGLQCSQILLQLGLDLQGRSNPELVATMRGLCGGLSVGETCGALTGGACLLSLYAGHGVAGGEDDPRLLFMLDDFVTWFKAGFGEAYGSLRCEDILGPMAQHLTDRCPAMVLGVYQKVKDLLVENGFELTGEPL
jgi:hypothetical protein